MKPIPGQCFIWKHEVHEVQPSGFSLDKQLAEVIARLLYYRTVHVWDSREAVNENVQAKLSFRCRGSYHCEEQLWSALVKDQLGFQISRLWQTDQSTCTKRGHLQSLLQSATKLPRHIIKWGPLGNKKILTPPLSPPFNVGVFVVFYR